MNKLNHHLRSLGLHYTKFGHDELINSIICLIIYNEQKWCSVYTIIVEINFALTLYIVDDQLIIYKFLTCTSVKRENCT